MVNGSARLIAGLVACLMCLTVAGHAQRSPAQYPPSILEVPGAEENCVELYTLTKGHSMAGWRVGFVVGNADAVAALGKLKSYLDYGTFQPIQIAAIIALNEGDSYIEEVNGIYEARRNSLVNGLNRAGWEIEAPKGTMFVWASIPETYSGLGSLDFAIHLLKEAKVAVSPGPRRRRGGGLAVI